MNSINQNNTKPGRNPLMEGERNAGGKQEAAKEPGQTQVHRAKWGRAARGDRAGWPAERRRVGGRLGGVQSTRRPKGTGQSGEGSPRRPRGPAGRAPAEGEQVREAASTRRCRPNGRGGQRVQEPRAGPRGILRGNGDDLGR